MTDGVRIKSERLWLRPSCLTDVRSLQAIASDPKVALTTASIPHPYPENGAKEFIARIHARSGPDRHSLAIIERETEDLIGMIGFAGDGATAELTYMIAPSRWGQGIATEAGNVVIRHLFDERGYARIFATAMIDNPASERVLQKLGFERQGEERREVPLRGGIFLISTWLLARHRHGGPTL